MAAGFVNQTIAVSASANLSQTFYSSDGTVSGNNKAAVVITDGSNTIIGGAAAAPIYVATDPVAVVSANFTRPADTTAYASGDLVANNTAAGSVTPMTFANAVRASGGSGRVRRARLKKSTNTTTNASFRLHLYKALPTLTNGDNAAWLSTQSTYLGSIDITVDKAFSDPAAEGVGTNQSGTGSEINFTATGTDIYGLLEARAAYVPGNAEVFTVELEVEQK